MSKEVTEKKSTEVANVGLDDFGASPMDSQDIMIPKILVMQKSSKLLDDEKAKFGDFVDSLTEEVIGSISSPIEVIPFHMEKVWFRSVQKANNQWELFSIEDFNSENSDLRYNDTMGGEPVKNELHMRFYCLRPEDTTLPYILTFKGMSNRGGKVLATQMYVKNRAAGLVPPAKTMLLSGSKEQNDKGTYVVINTSISRDSTQEEIALCLEWSRTIRSSQDSIRKAEVDKQKESKPDENFVPDNTDF